jgi:hypothetical protein
MIDELPLQHASARARFPFVGPHCDSFMATKRIAGAGATVGYQAAVPAHGNAAHTMP